MSKEESRNQTCQYIQEKYKDILADSQIDDIVNEIKNPKGDTYDVTGKIISAVVYFQVDGEMLSLPKAHFHGKGGGAVAPATGIFRGALYTEDTERLLEHTKSFSYIGAPLFLSIIFYDGNSKVLGHIEATGLTLSGFAGGTCHWDMPNP